MNSEAERSGVAKWNAGLAWVARPTLWRACAISEITPAMGDAVGLEIMISEYRASDGGGSGQDKPKLRVRVGKHGPECSTLRRSRLEVQSGPTYFGRNSREKGLYQ